MTIDQEPRVGVDAGGQFDGIHVDDLGTPEPSPFTEEELAGAEPDVEVPRMTDEEAGQLLGELLGFPFAFAGGVYASRARQAVPSDPELPLAIEEVWRLSPAEASRIGGRVFAAIPARFREPARGALERSPLGMAVGSIALAVRSRHRASVQAITIAAAQAAQEESVGDQSPYPAQPMAPRGGPVPRAAGGGGDRDTGSPGVDVDPDHDAAAGLGLSGIVQSRAAQRRQRRLSG